MGNLAVRRDRIQDEESPAVVAAAEAAAAAARSAVVEGVHRGEEAAAAAAAADGGGVQEGAAPGQALIAGIIPLPDAETAAGESARTGVQAVVRVLPLADRRRISASDLLRIQASAAEGAVSGVMGSAFMAALNAPAAANPLAAPAAVNPQAVQVVDMDKVIAASASGSWAASYGYVGALPTRCNANRWASRLPPVLAASLVLAAAAYPHFAGVSGWVIIGLYGGLFVVILTLALGILAVPLKKSMASESMSRHATFGAFITLIVLLTIVLITLFKYKGFIIFSGLAGGLVAVGLVYLWCVSGPY